MSGVFTATLVAAGLIAGSAQAAPTAPPTERELFVSVCTPRMSARVQKQPELVCGCLHDNAVSKEEDTELRMAMIRGVEENGVPSIRYVWVPSKPPERVIESLDRVAAPTLACMFDKR